MLLCRPSNSRGTSHRYLCSTTAVKDICPKTHKVAFGAQADHHDSPMLIDAQS